MTDVTLYYSKATGGFYADDVHGESIPADAVEVTLERHAELFAAQAAGKRIVAGPDGSPIAVDPPAPSVAEVEAMLGAAVQQMLDAAARSLRYDDMATAVTYAEEPAVLRFQQEGRALRAWRSQVWEAAATLMVGMASQQPPPDPQALVARLPPFIAP